MKILVTGAAGFIGSHLVDELLANGNDVVGLDNLRNGTLANLQQACSSNRFRFIKGDILNENDCADACKNCDVVYHLACLGVRHSLHSPLENHRVNAEGTLRVLEAATREDVRRCFYISTSEIYGKATSFPIKESDRTYPTTVYGASKLAGEHYALAFKERFDLDATVLRIFNNYGPRAHYEGDAGEVIPRAIVRIMNNENPVIFGDGQVTRDFLFVKDTARVLSRLLDVHSISGETINIGTGEEITIKDLIEALIERMPQYNVNIEFLAGRPADVPRLWVDNAKLREVLSLDDLMDFDTGLQQTIEYYQNLGDPSHLIDRMDVENWHNAARKC